MLCSRCKKNIAVVFITRLEGDKTVNEGLCLKCANELGISPVKNMMDRLGMTPEDVEQMSTELMESMGADGDGEGDESSIASLPFFQNMMLNQPQDGEAGEGHTEKRTAQKNRDKKRKFLESYCQNLTRKASEGKLDNIVGREKELTRMVQILNRRSKNNPCLIGEPGVGKTAVVEALAQHIVEHKVPAKLQNKEIYMLDLTALVAGTQFRGQFESRLKGLVDEVRSEGNIILFLDEVHNLMAAGDAEGAMNAANILKPALSRGEIQMIGATTLKEYRKHIEKDAALERRFQPIVINEPSVSDTIEILKGIKGYYEKYHSVKISDEVLRQAVLMSERYITDRFLPDKAIDLIDEACSDVNLKNAGLIEQQRLNDRLAEIKKEWEPLLDADPDAVYKRVAEIKSEECRINERLRELKSNPVPTLTVDDIARVIELWTDIPASRICQQEFERLISIESRIKKRIVGQDEAVDAVACAIRRNRAGISPKRKPVTMIFAGPTGIGKTELVKTLANELFDTPDALIRLDMSEFMEKHSVSRIIGAPPGYVGYDDAGQLTEKVRRKPYCVILFDEIEKAHPDVLNILLQIMDDGSVRDSHGNLINFENAVIIMTTNAGSNLKQGSMGFQKTLGTMAKEKTMKALSDFLRPEFLNRVDEIIVFNPLEKSHFDAICRIMLDDLALSLKEKGVELRYTDEAAAYIVDKSFSIEYGARSLRRFIQREVENNVANIVIEHYNGDIAGISIDCGDSGLKYDFI